MSLDKHSDEMIQIKINIGGKNVHFTRIRKTFWDKLNISIQNTSLSDRTKWIKEMSKREFGINLDSEESLKQFDDLKLLHNYEDRGDWLRDKIRHFLKQTT